MNNRKTKYVKQKPAATPAKKSKPAKRSKLATLQLPEWTQMWLPAIALFLTTLLLLALGYGLYLRKVESLSLFLPTQMFFDQCMSAPAGFLTWVSLWLTQTFYHPWLGALVYASLLTALAFAIKGAFGIRKGAFGYVIIVPALVLLAFLRLGYVIFSLKTPGYAFLFPLGLLTSTLIFWGVRLINNWWIKSIATVASIVLGYWLAGIYGIIGGALCVLGVIFRKQTSAPHQRRLQTLGFIIFVLVTVAACVFVPRIWFHFDPGSLMLERISKYGLPRFAMAEGGLKIPYVIAFVTMALFAVFGRAKWLTRYPLTAQLVWVLMIVDVLAFEQSDPNFRLTLRLDRAMQEGNWQQVVDEAKAFKHEPTRLNTALADVAAIRLGVAGNELFALPFGSEEYKTARALRVMHDAGAMPISYHLGKINYAYRWAMEAKVEYGTNVEQLKYLAKCALLNGEYPLARKYLRILSMTAHHKRWAEKYMAYADDPSLIDADPELAAIKRLRQPEDKFIYDEHTFENYVWHDLAKQQYETAELQELSIMSALITFDIDLAVSKLGDYYAKTGQLPQHMQEAVVLWSFGNENNYCDAFGINPAVKQRFMNFLQYYNTYGETPSEDQLKTIKDAFGDTYWFYFFYTPNMMII